MLCLPSRFAAVIVPFAALFFQRSWRHAEVLLLGAILTPGARMATRLLRMAGLADERHFVNYHRVLSRAVWSPRTASRLLLGRLLDTLVPDGPLVLGLDDTIERRRGKRIAAKGIYRDPVRSSHGHFVKAKRSGNGPTKPSLAPHHACSPCSLSSRSWPANCRPPSSAPPASALGIVKRSRSSPTRWPPCAAQSGTGRVLSPPPKQPISKNSSRLSAKLSSMPSESLFD